MQDDSQFSRFKIRYFNWMKKYCWANFFHTTWELVKDWSTCNNQNSAIFDVQCSNVSPLVKTAKIKTWCASKYHLSTRIWDTRFIKRQWLIERTSIDNFKGFICEWRDIWKYFQVCKGKLKKISFLRQSVTFVSLRKSGREA